MMFEDHHHNPALPILPVMSRKRFAELIGVTEDTVGGWINRRYLPVIKIGKYSLVNVALLYQHALQQDYPD
ncbi:hypothetical protein [Methylobacillus glycogenes]|uniref:hypothetical protein n=1 Tax=Methylobacillus glycogenes TaxID=406 RepID=UPI0011DE1708|nr:hypothetical protein [Methylobacillus glycogenes]